MDENEKVWLALEIVALNIDHTMKLLRRAIESQTSRKLPPPNSWTADTIREIKEDW
ncbi:hypothetical protein [Saccharopolyspora pogona]|uniref:hypothetical protein n=1 Tax=Saccharopolyspora pogona TaxID=333966 RepID=UPI0016833923|nr:hypothetical protein [Saccharopolyspora pogona]